MPTIERLGPNIIRVGPDRVTTCDLLEYAEALIGEKGWFHYPSDPGESDEKKGYTLHDAVNSAGERIEGSGGKDFGGLREKAVEEVVATATEEEPQFSGDDKAWENAPGRTKEEVLALLRRSIERCLEHEYSVS